MRAVLVMLHRWLGLFTALFLLVAGLTGAVIAWDHELDAWLNPAFNEAETPGKPQSALALAEKLEQREPRVQVTYLPLQTEPGEALSVFVAPRLDPATGKPFLIDYNQITLDPATGEVQGRRMWGAFSLAWENLPSFLYKLHYSLHLPDVAGVRSGVLLLGIVAMVWVIDCVIALWISFPNRRSWRKSFGFRWRAGGQKLTFDIHRSGGVWLWLLLLVVAVTSVSMNLEHQVMRPLVNLVSPLQPTPFAGGTGERDGKSRLKRELSREQILQMARSRAATLSVSAPMGGMFFSPAFDVYGVGFFKNGNAHGDVGLGNPWLYFDAHTGEPVATTIPGTGSAGDIFLQMQFPLHSGRIAGLPGRILVSCLGVLVAGLSMTGIIIWARRRRARARSQLQRMAKTLSTTALAVHE